MAVITISRELGSGGLEIAQMVAERLGYDLVDKRLADGIFRQYGLTRFDQVYNEAPSFLDLLNADNLLIVSMLNEILEAVGKRGNAVILGRAGFAVLGGYADVLNVRVEAPVADRVARLMAREGLTDAAAAEAQIAEDDKVHRQYVQRFYNRQWDDPANFAVVVDTAVVPIPAAVDLIVAAGRAREQKSLPADAVTTASLVVDPVLDDAVAKVMAYPLPG